MCAFWAHRAADGHDLRHAAPALAQLSTDLTPDHAAETAPSGAGYSGDSLQEGTLADWNAASYEIRLRTTADWVRRIGSVSGMRWRTRDAESTRRFAAALEACISTVARSAPPSVLANPAADIGVSCAVTLNHR